ncbi:hypothetical protein CDS [Bradyrhizobium sp.]|nr:hypothetical protein CDS [Bradyrhizobium sp.]
MALSASRGMTAFLVAHGTTKDTKFPCLIVIGFRLNPV